MTMLQSQLFTKTKKEAPHDEVAKNAQLLIRAGYIHKELAGVYAFLPLGRRVIEKIVAVIREEMAKIGGQEVMLTALQDPELWKATKRWSDEALDIWFKTKLKNGGPVGLATTHEEPLTALMKDHIESYRDLPQYVFQFQTKFRNELRAKNGLLRTREFLMKDLYSFTATAEELDKFYEQAQEAYRTIFQRLGIGDDTVLTFASGGAFSKYSHEFQTVCPAGEDTIYLAKDKKIAINREVLTDDVLADLKLKRDELEEVAAIEVGNIFKLGTRFSEPLGLTYLDKSGQRQPVVMGSYGIGPARVMAAIVEKFSDEHGLVWPEAIAPFAVHLIAVDASGDESASREAMKLHTLLQKEGVEVLYDDRDVSPGTKFSDADLIGIPYRVVISAKTLKSEKLEVKNRRTGEVEFWSEKDLLKRLTNPLRLPA